MSLDEYTKAEKLNAQKNHGKLKEQEKISSQQTKQAEEQGQAELRDSNQAKRVKPK